MILLALLCPLLFAPEELDELEALQAAVAAAVDRVAPSVVTITTRGGVRQAEIPEEMKKKMTLPERPRGDGEGEEEAPEGKTERFKNEWEKMLAWPGFQKAEGPTTGVVVSPDGHIVTSSWNFDGKPNVIVVTLADGSGHAARLLGIDRAAGLALLKIEATGLPVPQFLDPRTVEVGAWAFALGRTVPAPLPEIKYGIVSAKNRVDGKAIQTDAATSPANYGGPLIDVEGRVYGILVPLGGSGEDANPNWYDSGIGFAVPVPDPARFVARLGREGAVLLPAFLGVEMDQDRTEPGARVVKVLEDSPAAKGGLLAEDIIVAVEGEEVRNSFALRFAVGARRAGDTIRLTVLRGAERSDVTITLGERAAGEPEGGRVPVPMPAPDGKPSDKRE
ncbi:MAG: S1C family serine protease [Planctomycetaceae bacterium]